MEEQPYIEGEKVIEADNRFKHVMAISLNPASNYKQGVIRCITSREGDIAMKGNIDRSELHKIDGSSLEDFKIGQRLNIKNEKKWTDQLTGSDGDFLGLEDPDIWIDEADLMHLYFTIPVKKGEHKYNITLGHAIGEDLESLEMMEPALTGSSGKSAKEVSIAPSNSKGVRLNLIESSLEDKTHWCSTIRIAIAKNMSKPWEFGETIFNPLTTDRTWIAGHASPGPLFPKTFIDVGEGKLLGIINGCEANQGTGDAIKYGNFSIGLFIYDYENGKINWVSETPFIQDSEAGKGGSRAITFASQFIETEPGKGILYAHVDDSFVRSYSLNAEGIRKLLP